MVNGIEGSVAAGTGGASADGAPREGARRVLDPALFGRAFLRGMPVAVALGVIAAAIAVVALPQVTPIYSAKTVVRVAAPGKAVAELPGVEAPGSEYAAFIDDDAFLAAVSRQVGETVGRGGVMPDIEISTTNVPGVLEIITRSGTGSEKAAEIGDVAVRKMNEKGDEVRGEFLGPIEGVIQRRIDDLSARIAEVRGADPLADVQGLLALVYDAEKYRGELRARYPRMEVIARSGDAGGSRWPAPLATGAVVGTTVFLVAGVVLSVMGLRRRRRVDPLWARVVAGRYGAETEIDVAPAGELPALADAAVATTLSRDLSVVILGGPVGDLVPEPVGEARVFRADLADPWWRRIPPSQVGRGLVVVDVGAEVGAAAEAAIRGFTETGVPVRLVVRTGAPR